MKASDISEVIAEIMDRESEAVWVETNVGFSKDMLRYILEEYVTAEVELTDEERYAPLVAHIEERHQLGQEVTGTDILHWIKYG